jgi:flagellar biosynthetic protein FlhB
MRAFHLQLFAEERTEPATPRKRQKTREEGQVARSQDLGAAVVILVGLLARCLLSRSGGLPP